MTPTALVFWLCASAAASLLLLIFGWRGRRVDDHPHCRRCGFDLFGKPPDSTRCSECGADLNRRQAVLSCARVRRKSLLVLALLLAVVAGTLGWARAEYEVLHTYIPQWWLMRDLQNSDPAKRDFAMAELTRRIVAGELAPEYEAALRDMAFANQVNLDRPWDNRWGIIVESLKQAGHLSAGAWDQYLLNSIVFCLSPENPTMRLSDDLRFQVFRAADRRSGRPLPKWTGYPFGFYVSPNMDISGNAVKPDIPYTGTLDWRPEDEIPKVPGLISAELYFEPCSKTDSTMPQAEADFTQAYRNRRNDENDDENVHWDPQLAAKLKYGQNTATMTITVAALWHAGDYSASPGNLRLRTIPLKTTWTFTRSARLNHGE